MTTKIDSWNKYPDYIPKEEAKVIVVGRNKNNCRFISFETFEKGFFEVDDEYSSVPGYCHNYIITHWMEFTEPPNDER